MTTTHVIQTIIEIVLIALIVLGFRFENKLIEFENKILEVIRRK